MGKPVNMNPEEYARQIIAEQQKYIEYLEENQKPGGGPPQPEQKNIAHPSLYEREPGADYQGDK